MTKGIPMLCCAVLSHSIMSSYPMRVACQAPLVMRILQARILEWVAMTSSRGCTNATVDNITEVQ